MTSLSRTDTIFRLTALWAFAECALGGVMHALKLPFTGLLVGGFAVLCIGLLAHVGGRSAAVILRSTLLVVLVKAMVSPHSPPAAYLAVAFQGVSGALLLGYLRPYALAAYLFGCLAMLESALQKLLLLWLFYGNPLLQAIDTFFNSVLDTFNVQSEVSWSAVLVYSYLGLYALWGLLLGRWILKLPGQLEDRAVEYAALDLRSAEISLPETKKSGPRWLLTAGILLFIALTFLLAGGKAGGAQKALYAVARTLAVLIAWFFIVQPLVTWLFHRWARKRAAAEQSQLRQIIDFLPDLRLKAGPLYRYVSEKYTGWRRIREFVIAYISIACAAGLPER